MKKKLYSRYKEFTKLPPSNFDIPVIRNSSPYVSDTEQLLKENVVGQYDNPFSTIKKDGYQRLIS